METAIRRSGIGVLAALLSVTLSPTLCAAEALVNTTTAGDQIRPKVAISENGDFIVTWKGPSPVDQSSAYIGQRYNASSAPIGDEFVINPVVIGTSGEINHGVAMRSDGAFYTVADDIVQAHAADGTPTHAPSELDIYKNGINAPDRISENRGIASNIYGETIAVFQSYFSSGSLKYGIIHVQRFDTLGNPIGERQRVHESFVERRTPSVAIANNGQYGVVWSGTVDNEEYGTPAKGNIYASLYNADGTATLQEFTVNQSPDGSYKYDPDIAFDNDGNFVVVWKTLKGEVDKIYARLFDNTGTALGDEFLVHDDTLFKNTTPTVAMRYDGRFVVAWDNGDNPANGRDIFARHFDATGQALAPTFTVNTTTQGRQIEPDVAINSEGDIIFAWASEDQEGNSLDIMANVQAHPTASTKPITSTPPLAFAGPDQSILEGSLVNLDASDSFDPYGTITSYFWSQNQGDTVILEGANTATPQFTAPENTSGPDIMLTFEVRVTNSNGLTDTDTVTIAVQDSPPVADAGDDFRANFNTVFTLNASKSYDPDGGSITSYQWSVVNDASDNVNLQGTTGVEVSAQKFNSGANTPYLLEEGVRINRTSTFQVVVTNSNNLEDSDQITVTYNMPPEVDATANAIIYPGQEVTLDGSASSDYDGTLTSFEWKQSSGEPVTLVDADKAIATFIAGPVSATPLLNTLRFTLTVRDNEGAPDNKTVELLLKTSSSQPPIADAGQNIVAEEGTLVSLNGAQSDDPDGNITSYVWRQIDNGAPSVTLSSTTIDKPTFTAPEVGDSGAELMFELRVVDNDNLSDTATIVVSITNIGQAPVADAGRDANALEGSTVSLDGSRSTDPDDNLSEYLWTQTGGPTVALSSSTNAQPTFTAPEVDSLGETLEFTLKVTDTDGLSDSDTVTINIVDATSPGNQKPTADAGENMTVTEGTMVTLNGSDSMDLEDTTVTSYQWSQTNFGPRVSLSSNSEPQPTFTAPAVTGANITIAFDLVVTDSEGLASNVDTVTITVVDTSSGTGNQRPVANAGGDVSVVEKTALSLDGSGSNDPDGSIATYLWSQTSGPSASVVLSSLTEETLQFTAPDFDSANAQLTFALVVTDNEGMDSVADEVTVTITKAGSTTASSSGDSGGGGSLAWAELLLLVISGGLATFMRKRRQV